MQKKLLLIFLCLVLGFGLWSPVMKTVWAQDTGVMTYEPAEPSGGSYMLHKSAASLTLGPYIEQSDVSLAPSIGDTFESLDFDDNGTETGYVFIPPDPIGAAGTDRLIAVVNVMIEARYKTGTQLWYDSLKDFFSSLTAANWLFDPKIIYDHYEDRFLVVALEKVESGSNPDSGGGNTSRILLAVSKTSTPATATSADWYYTAVDGEESIDGFDCWTDYPGFEVDEEAVYVTGNMFRHSPLTGSSVGSRLWIVDKGTSGGFYAGGTAAVTKHDPYASGGIATTTMPAQVYGDSGIGGTGGTYLVSFSGINDGVDEFVQVVRINDPLGTPSFSQEYINVGNIDNLATLPDAPQLNSTTDIEVNDRRALDAVWRNNKLWFTTTINPRPPNPDANQTTAHWFKLDTSAAPIGTITLDDQGNIGGEDIATSVYTFFPSVAVNNFGDAAFGFCASASTIYAGAYVTAHMAYDAAGTVQPSETVHIGTDYYVRTFGGSLNRWGDYTGAALDPTDDNTVWLFNQYAMARGSGTPPEDGRWGTAWASYLFTTWDSYSGSYPDDTGVRNDEFDDYGSEHDVYMYGTGFGSETTYKIIYWDANVDDVVVESKSSDVNGVLKSTHTFDPGVDAAGDWHITVYNSSAEPVSYSPTDPDIVADDTSFTDGYSLRVEQSAIPEFPTILAVVVVMALSAGIYLWMRRKAVVTSA